MMDATPCTLRLFACLPTPTERAEYRSVNRAGAMSLFDVAPVVECSSSCPACGATSPELCTCDRTGAEALPLPLRRTQRRRTAMSTTTTRPWWQEPLRPREYDVPVYFRVTGDDAATCRENVARAIERDPSLESDLFAMWTPPIAARDIFEDGGVWRVLEEQPATGPETYWRTLATFATMLEARAFLEGVNYQPADRADTAQRTYRRAVAEFKAARP